MSGHTPGPWRALQSGYGVIAGDAETWSHVICWTAVNATQRKDPRNTANAHLIAAAPELLDGLWHMQSCRSCAEGSWEDCDGGRAALAAIAKAEPSK